MQQRPTPNFGFRATLLPGNSFLHDLDNSVLMPEVLNLAVIKADFSVVRSLHRRKGGVLFLVKFLVFKRRI